MINQRYELIDKSHIESLVSNEVRENSTLEYKEYLPGNSDADKKELLADVSAFANGAGGDLIFGVKEKRDAENKPTGIPEMAAGLQSINADAEVGRLENIIRDGLDPRLPVVHTRPIEGFSQGPVILMRIPKSWAAPHMITYKGSSKFYARNNRGKQQLDVREIRAAFNLSEGLTDKIRRFRDERLGRIIAGETPLPIKSDPKIVLHVLPVTSFNAATVVDIASFEGKSINLKPMCARGWDGRFNVDGFVSFSRPGDPQWHTYVQLFRNGIIEAVETSTLETRRGEKLIPAGVMETNIFQGLDAFLKVQRDLDVDPPLFVMVNFIGVSGYVMSLSNVWRAERTPIDRDLLLLPEIIIENYDVNTKEVLRPVFDAIWQAAGYARCLDYDERGEWKPQWNC